MPKRALTDLFVRSVKPGEATKIDYFDSDTAGFCLRVSGRGVKTFFLVYTRPSTGKRAWKKLGVYPEISLGDARKKAKDLRGDIADGNDPLAKTHSDSALQTVSDLVESYIKRHASTRRTGPAIARRLRKNVSGKIGGIELSKLHRRDITKCLDAVKDRGAPMEANRVFEDIRAMVRWARARGDLDEMLTEGMTRPSEPRERDRVLTADEIRTVWAALPDADMREATRRILRLCLITGQRVGEIAGMRREELDWDRLVWTIPAERVKNGREHSVPVTAAAAEVIRAQLQAVDELAARKDRKPGPFIFPGPGGRAPITGAAIPKAVKRAETRGARGKAATIMGVKPWTPHDLRRTMATHMEESGISPFIVGHVLNHTHVTKSTITSRAYARYDYAREKREALELWADRLQGILSGGAEVAPLQAGAA